jgi:hypothetical protein
MADRGIALSFRDLGARRGWVASTTPRPLYPRERPGTHCTGGWVGPRAGLDVCKKISPPPGFDPRTLQPRSQSLDRLSYPSHTFWRYLKKMKNYCRSPLLWSKKYGKPDVKKGATLSINAFGILRLSCLFKWRKRRRGIGLIYNSKPFCTHRVAIWRVYRVGNSGPQNFIAVCLTISHIQISVSKVMLFSQFFLCWDLGVCHDLNVKVSIVLSCGSLFDDTASLRHYQQFSVPSWLKRSAGVMNCIPLI